MSFFDRTTIDVEIDQEHTITIQPLTYGEEQDIKQQCMTVRGRAGQEGGEVSIDAIKMQRLTMQRSIVAWSGPGFDGRPVTPESIEALPVHVLAPVVDVINQMAQGLDDAEKKPLTGRTN
jgi:hypothetical protein